MKRSTGRAIAAGAAVVAVLLGLSTNVASTLVPADWTHHHALLVWIAVGVLAALAVAFATLTAPEDEPGEPSLTVGDNASGPVVYAGPGSHVQIQSQAPAPAPAQAEGQIVVGELPGTPPVFIARTAVENLREVFAGGAGVATVTTVSGGRGAGKTQVAAEYARRAIAARVPLVAWVSAEDQGKLLAGLVEVASRLGVADPEGDSERSATRLREELSTRTEPGVLVLDNATDPDVVRPYLPGAGATQILITTTDRGFASLGSEILVQPFDRAQSLAYLIERTGLDDEPGAETVADALGNLPLALGQAATVIKLRGWSFSRYLERHEELPLDDLLPADRGDAYPHGTAKAILLAVTTVEEDDPTGATTHVLETIALLSPDGVSRTVLSQVVGIEPGQLDEILGHLVETSLLVWTTDRTAIVMHRLVGRALRDRLERSGRLMLTMEATSTGLVPLMVSADKAWLLRELTAEVADHTLVLWDTAVRAADRQILTPADIAKLVYLAHWRVVHLTATADLSRTIDEGRLLLRYFERILGLDHRDTITARNNLANVYETAGDLDRAIPLCEAALADRERILGPDHPSTLTSRNNLAGAYQAAGDLERAVPLYEANLADRERILGPDHPKTLLSRNNLAGAYEAAGDLKRAIPLYEANLADRERILGPDHPDTLVSRNNLAYAYRRSGDLAQAVPLYEAALSVAERVLSPGHPSIQMIRQNLEAARRAQSGPTP